MAKREITKKLQTKRVKSPKDFLPAKEESFIIETSVGDVELAAFRLTFGDLVEISEVGEEEKMVKIALSHVTDDTRETLNKVPLEELTEVFELWSEASRVDLGESGA